MIIGSSLWNIIDRASGYNFSCFGLRSCVISSDSMSYVSESNKEVLNCIDNRLYKNDLIFNMEVNSIDDLKVNDIVTYVTDNNQLVTHRVYEIVIQDDKGYVVFPIAKTDTLSPAWTELETTDFLDDTIKFNPMIGEVSKRFVTAVGLNRKVGEKDQRIVIVGDADFLCNNEFRTQRADQSMNETLILGTCFWLSEGKAPLDVSRPMASDNKVFLTQTSEKLIRAGVTWVFPLCVLGAAVYVWIRRRGR